MSKKTNGKKTGKKTGNPSAIKLAKTTSEPMARSASRSVGRTSSISKTIRTHLEGLDSPFVTMSASDTESYLESILAVTSHLTDERAGIYVTANRSFPKLKELLKKNDIDSSRLTFIDVVSFRTDPSLKNTPAASYVNHPSNLTDLNLHIIKSLDRMKAGRKFVIIDSLSTLLAYNQQNTLTHFLHSLSIRLHNQDTDLVLISVSDERSKSMEAIFSQFCDKIIRV